MTVVFKNAQSGKELYRYAFMREAGETPDFAVFKASTGDQDEHIYLGKIGAGGGAVEPADREQVRKSGISIEIRTFRETYLSGIKHIVVESTETIDQSDASLYFRETSPISIIAKQWIKTAGVFSYWDCKEL